MLMSMQIKNFVLVESVSLEFHPQLTTITGETGAGKSLLLDALGAVLGDKSQAFWVRPQSDKADISAEFDVSNLPAAQAWLSEQDFDEDSCILRRVIGNDGKSKAYINGSSVTLTQLRQLGEHLVAMHSQHEHHALLQASTQLNILDTWAKTHTLRQQVKQAFSHWQTQVAYKEQLLADVKQRAERLALVEFQLEELGALKLNEGDVEQLELRHKQLSHAQTILQAYERAIGYLSDEREGALNRLYQSQHQLDGILDLEVSLPALVSQISSAVADLEDARQQLQQLQRHVEIDDYALAECDQRLSQIHRLSKKYFIQPDQIWQKVETLQAELSELRAADQAIDGIDDAIAQALADYAKVADQLSQARNEKADTLSQAVITQLHDLGMTHSRLAWHLLKHEQPQATGWETAEIRFSANPGQALYPMSKVASGGELARISLAIEVCVAAETELPLLVFDEVDVGVGGGVADAIGQKLAAIANNKQVLCITHQPQVAAWGDAHWRIAKISDGNTTLSTIQVLDEQSRIDELARMMGTRDESIETQQHAMHLLNRTRKQKAS